MFTDFETYYKEPLPYNPLFIEVGANKGQWQKIIIQKYPQCMIHAFEPIPGITPTLPNVRLSNYAIDIYDNEKKKLFITKNNVTSSLLKINKTVTKNFDDFVNEQGVLHKKSDLDVQETIIVQTKRLDTYLNSNYINNIHYLKIDTEGNDFNVIKSLDNYSGLIWAFEMEVWNKPNTLFIGSSWIDEIVPYVENKGFKLVNRFVHGRGLSSDLLFINNKIFC